MFKRRVGPNPHIYGGTPGSPGCPDIWELETGDFAFIGRDETNTLSNSLPADASCGPEERIVVIPRHIVLGAKGDIPGQ